MINVTQPYIPPLEEYTNILSEIWERRYLTNQGPCVKELEIKLTQYLGVEFLNYVTNGTIAIQLAIRELGLNGSEIITTPFTYVATTSAILLENCIPVYVDIDPETLCIDPNKIEEAITEKTKAILAVHVFGLPCNVHKIEEIAKKYNLKVIYDAAHAFGAKYKGKSLLNYGDISTCSFHATKLFHTVEGGAVISTNKEDYDKISLAMRFGHNGDDHLCLGTNAKVSEVHAAMGLVNIGHIQEIIKERKLIVERYDSLLQNIIRRPEIAKDLECNYAYYPIILKSEKELFEIMDKLKEKEIYPRRYFYPSLNKLKYIINANDCPISEDISNRILCLPLYCGLSLQSVDEICKYIQEALQ